MPPKKKEMLPPDSRASVDSAVDRLLGVIVGVRRKAASDI
jgi:hypothetical protein